MQIKKAEEKSMQVKQAKAQSIKVKEQSIKMATVTGAKLAAEQVDGGNEMQDAALTAYVIGRPIAGATKQGAKFARDSAKKAHDRRIKRKEQKVAKQEQTDNDEEDLDDDERRTAEQDEEYDTEQDIEQDEDYEMEQNADSDVELDIEPEEADKEKRFGGKKKSSSKGDSDKGHSKRRKKGIRGLIRNLQMAAFIRQGKSEDGEGKSSRWQMLLMQKIVIPVLGFLALGMMLVALVALPVMLVIALIYNSPFAIFFPPLESGDTVQSVTSAYVAEFNRVVNELVDTHEGYDVGRVVYVDYEGTNASPTNYYDILSVYMVKHGIGDSATLINDTTKGWIETVVDDMCDYTMISGTETSVDADGNEVNQSVLYVNVTLRDYTDMISYYGFGSNEVDLLKTLMSPESMAMLGYSGDSSTGVSSVSRAEINRILNAITDEKQKKTCSYVLSKVGYPYSQAYRDSGDYYDCSSLAYYAWQYAGVNISYGGATTAAAEAQGLEESGKTVEYEIYDSGNGIVCNGLLPGDLIFYSYCHNGRYKNISHVAIYVGDGKVVEAKSESAGVAYGNLSSPTSIVLVGRPQ